MQVAKNNAIKIKYLNNINNKCAIQKDLDEEAKQNSIIIK